VLCPSFFRTNIVDAAIGAFDDAKRRFVEAEMTRSKYDADDVARIAVDAAERGKLYAMPHGELRWLWRLKRVAPGAFVRFVALLERRGAFAR